MEKTEQTQILMEIPHFVLAEAEKRVTNLNICVCREYERETGKSGSANIDICLPNTASFFLLVADVTKHSACVLNGEPKTKWRSV